VAVFIVIAIITPPAKECEFLSDEAPASNNQNQIAVILAPTNSFVDMNAVITRAKTDITSALGSNLSDSEIKLAENRELSVVIADGNPKLIVHLKVGKVSGLADTARRTISQTLFGSIEKVISCSVGEDKKPTDQVETSPEVDYLKSLDVASAQLTSTGQKDIFVLGNGIQTFGAIQMQDKDLFPRNDKQANKLARALDLSNSLPDLTGVRVHWFGLGQVDGEYQKPLSLGYQKGLITFWNKVVSLRGGKLIETCTECGSGKPSDSAIQVSKVVPSSCNLIVELYDGDGVEFKHDQSVFVSESKALSAAQRTVSKFKAKKCDSLTVTGYAAAGKDKSDYEASKSTIDAENKTLTEERASAFAVLLRQAGFQGEINFVGGGTCLTEWNEEGKTVESLQRLCRKVEVSN
jgi:hypothetical protein